jgi:hypothetical protein
MFLTWGAVALSVLVAVFTAWQVLVPSVPSKQSTHEPASGRVDPCAPLCAAVFRGDLAALDAAIAQVDDGCHRRGCARDTLQIATGLEGTEPVPRRLGLHVALPPLHAAASLPPSAAAVAALLRKMKPDNVAGPEGHSALSFALRTAETDLGLVEQKQKPKSKKSKKKREKKKKLLLVVNAGGFGPLG